MPNRIDPVDEALERLGARSWQSRSHAADLEQRLLSRHDARRRGRVLFGLRTWQLAAGVVFLVGSVAFAATGGADVVRHWFSVVFVHTDGRVIEPRIIEQRRQPDGTQSLTVDLGEQGRARVKITPPESDKEGKKRLQVELPPATQPESRPAEAPKPPDDG